MVDAKAETKGTVGFYIEKEELVRRLCVVRTLDSMLTQVAGREVRLDDEATNLRLRQLAEIDEIVRRRKREAEEFKSGDFFQTPLFYDTLKADQKAIRKFVQHLLSSESDAGDVLRECELRFERIRHTEDIFSFVEQGYAVAPIRKPRMFIIDDPHVVQVHFGVYGVHVFHIGVSEDRRWLTNISDQDIRVQDRLSRLETEQLEFGLQDVYRNTREWNVFLLRKKETTRG